VGTRIVARKLAEVLGQQVIVDNRAGAGGFIGARAAASSPPDGYTLYACGISTHGTGPALYKSLPVDPEKDFSPIGMIGSNPNVLVVNPSVPVKTVAEFIVWAKAGAGNLSYASPGVGTAPHLTMELLKHTAQIDLIAVTYKGDAAALQDVMGGHVSTMFGGLGQHLAAIRSGMTRAVAVTSLKRHRLLPDVPTLDESGFPGLSVVTWVGLCAPAHTPEPILDILNAATVRAVNDPEVRDQMMRGGWDAESSSRKELAAFIRTEIARWRKVTQAAAISLD
jgi:tripartite-type tricarboxylate transporter receptor subunit TctC